MVTQIKSVDGYSDDLPVAFVNAGENSDASIFDNNEAVKEMPHYPDSGSIKIIDGVVVVKF